MTRTSYQSVLKLTTRPPQFPHPTSCPSAQDFTNIKLMNKFETTKELTPFQHKSACELTKLNPETKKHVVVPQ